jgi:hypothetical protein
VLVAPNVQVDAGDPLLQLEAVVSDDEPLPGAPVDLDFGPASSRDGEAVEAMRAYLLGYDLDPAAMRRVERGDDPWTGLRGRGRDPAVVRRRLRGLSPTARARGRGER